MKRRTKFAIAGLGVALAATALSRAFRSSEPGTETVPYTVVETLDGVEIRQYPTTVSVETTAQNTGVAFRRLFQYISGANQSREKVSMTAPVTTESAGESIPMTAPVATDRTDRGVQLSFYLPSSYEYDTAPRPTNPDVELVEQSARTLAVRQFSWYATDRRTQKETDSLLQTLADNGVSVVGDAFLMQYDPPSTLPFFRTNEVAVEIQRRERGLGPV
ncbi:MULTISPECIES: heme-binding protein [Haloferax]|uniref:Heme-binding protein n=1 Tax=Haloferax marinum TaxID=2666143 RepID=A0A6A8G2G7_9EURY|nr:MULTISPECIES: heme-binding protein [Haloferax]KAB1196361.1 heme-binding protein [Haloferax sp. CBA1150]MRW95354.1 heme-binding protein [Haloferax marinum]